MLALVASAACAQAQWKTIDAHFRSDTNPWLKTQVWQNYPWHEGWRYEEQFWPNHMKAAGSLHVILRNESGKAAKLELKDVDGVALGEAATNKDRIGRVVWYNITPQEVQPGGWVECKVRLRESPDRDVKLGFAAGSESVSVTVPAAVRKTRIESISFSSKTDRIYIYVRALDGSAPQIKAVRLDGEAVRSQMALGPAKSGLALAEAPIAKPWDWGSFHLVELDQADGATLAYPVRASDSFFSIGLFGQAEKARVDEAKFEGINTYVAGATDSILDDAGMNYVGGWVSGRIRTPTQSGRLYYYAMDEPDGADTGKSDTVPYLDRLGLNAQMEVFPRYWNFLNQDPKTPVLLLVDGTYKPLHWYVYGQCCDVYSTDPYVPLGKTQMDYVARALECARDGSAPHPLMATLWATSIGNEQREWNQLRAPTPVEERMMVFYALGSGSKGIWYFADVDNFSGEELTGLSHYRPLFHEIGRINKDVAALAPDLAIGCPAGPAVETKQVWTRSIMCGANKMVAVVVNKQHEVVYGNRELLWKHSIPKNVKVSFAVPASFGKVQVNEVREGKLVPAPFELKAGKVEMTLDQVDTARAFVISR